MFAPVRNLAMIQRDAERGQDEGGVVNSRRLPLAPPEDKRPKMSESDRRAGFHKACQGLARLLALSILAAFSKSSLDTDSQLEPDVRSLVRVIQAIS